MDVREPIIATLEAMRESLVINAQEVQSGRVQVMNVDRVLNNVVAEIIRLSMDVAFLQPGTRHP